MSAGIRNNAVSAAVVATLLNLQKSLNKMFVGMENLVNDNIYKTKYLTEYEGNADDEEMTKEDD